MQQDDLLDESLPPLDSTEAALNEAIALVSLELNHLGEQQQYHQAILENYLQSEEEVTRNFLKR